MPHARPATTRPRPTPPRRAGLWLAACAAVALSAAAQAQDTLTVVTLNIWHNQGDWPARLDRIEDGLRALGPDVVLLQEVLQDEGLPNQAQTVADRLGLGHVHFVSWDSAGSVKRYGNAILSSRPLLDAETHRLPPADAYRLAASAAVEVGGRRVRLVTTHLHNPPTVEGRAARAMEIAHLLAVVEAGDGPVVIGGDFNAEPDWPEMGMLRAYRDLGGAGITWGPPYAGAPGRRIDYLFDTDHPGLAVLDAGRALDRPTDGLYPSDHFAVYARFLVRPPRP